jgi:membrane protein YqaA with SNARE-associated domain
VIRSNSNSDTSHFNFLVTSVTDEGNHHHINGTYVSGSAFDGNEIVAFDFFVTGDKGDQGIQGIQGPTGSSGATALLTGYVSGAGTVAATDTVVQAVGKLNGNDEQKAPISSLYPYIGGKLLTYLDEEAAIADPLISAGDIYRKTAGGVDYVNPDNVPSLDLRFATDKTLTARRGPTPTFSRASSGTFVNANGLIVGKTAGTTSSITPSTQAIGSQVTVTVASGSVVGWVVGQAISLIVDTDGQDDPDATELWLLGNIVSTTDTTLVFSVTSRTTQAGSATSWTLGYRGPRFDHDSAGVCRGLLIEEGRTNLLQRSEDFGNATWTKANSSISGTLYTAPTGASTANELVEDSLNAAHTCVQNAATATIGTTYTFSVFVKRKPSSNQFLLIGATNLVVASFISVNLTNGVTSTGIGSPGSPINVSSTAYPDGWYRVQFSVVATSAASITLDIRLSRDGTWANRSYLGDGVQSSLLWGAQVEAGSFATSYIPTTTSSLTRSADVCSYSDVSSFYNPAAGTLVGDLILYTPSTSSAPELFRFGAGNNRIQLGVTSVATEAIRPFIISGGTTTYNSTQGTIVAGTSRKVALTFATNDAISCLNGTLGTQDTSVTMPVSISTAAIGASALTGHIASIRYYKKRLPNAKLVTLTT